MPHQITIKPSGHVFFAQPGETVLQAALREGFPLPYGCRNGACGTCKGKIIQGTVDFGSYNEGHPDGNGEAGRHGIVLLRRAVIGTCNRMPRNRGNQGYQGQNTAMSRTTSWSTSRRT